MIEDFSVFSEFGMQMIASLKDLKCNTKKNYDIACKQTVITDLDPRLERTGSYKFGVVIVRWLVSE